MPKAVKLPSGNYRVQISVTQNGNKIRKSFTAATAKEALRYADDWQQHIRMIGTDSTALTVEEALNEYIELKKNVLSSSTLTSYKRYVKNSFDDLKHYKLYQLNSIIIQKSINNYAKYLSPKSLKNYYGLLKSALKMFYPELTLSLTFPQSNNKPKRSFSIEYIVSVLKAVENTKIEIPLLFAMLLSNRASEIAAVQRKDIDFENHTITFWKAKVISDDKFIIQEKNKNKTSFRTAAIPDLLYKKLLPFRDVPPETYICNINPNQFWQYLNRALKKANLEKMSFHDLRHINASFMLSLGINEQISMEIGGWKTNHIMKSVYQHSFSEERQQANSLLNDYFNSLVHTKMHTKN